MIQGLETDARCLVLVFCGQIFVLDLAILETSHGDLKQDRIASSSSTERGHSIIAWICNSLICSQIILLAMGIS